IPDSWPVLPLGFGRMIQMAFQKRMAVCAMAAGLFGSEPTSAAGPSEVAAARAILRSGDFVQAARIARILLAEAESSSGKDSLEAARAIDLVVTSLVRGGNARVPETGE